VSRNELATQETVEMGRVPRRTLGRALLITGAAAVLPGSGHLLLRRRIGALILGVFVLGLAALALFVLLTPRSRLFGYLFSPGVLRWAIVSCAVAALLWVSVVVRTYRLARPRPLDVAGRVGGAAVVLLLCLAVIAPFAYAASLANAQRSLVNALFPSLGADDANVFDKPRINILVVGSDAGADRTGARTDSMGVASIDTQTGRTTLFGLPRNIEYAQFPPGSKMAERFPNGFHDRREPTSGNYLLNAVYAYGTDNPDVAPPGPSNNPGLNLLTSSVSYMLGLNLDYYLEMDMRGFSSIVDALGGLDVDVGPNPIPLGGIGPDGEQVRPFGYIPPGRQHLTGEFALWFARSRTYSSDFERMGRQRCLIQDLISQKSPQDVLRNYQAVADATANSLATDIPQSVLPSLLALADQARQRPLESVSFDPSLPDPTQSDGKFDPGNPNFDLMRQVVREVTSSATAPTTTSPTATAEPTGSPTAAVASTCGVAKPNG
jgi:LCP family protein required for cell wall assembly